MRQSSICAVVISFRASAAILTNIELLQRQVGHVVVVDNTPQSYPAEALSCLERLDGCTVIRNGKNLGIAAALNLGIRRAISMGCEWIITFDQDSRVPEGFIEGMFSGIRAEAGKCRIGVLFPRYRDARLGTFLPTHRTANGDVVACMTSGSMVHADTFRTFGPMDERLFIDYVDLEYCLRLRVAGLKVIECPEAVLTHSLGRITRHKLLWKRFTTTNHSAKRRYYITRNRLVVIRRYMFKDFEWAAADFNGLIAEAIKMLLVEEDRLAKVGYMLRGIFDATFNRLGPRVAL